MEQASYDDHHHPHRRRRRVARHAGRSRPVTVLDIRNAEDRAEWAIPGSLHVDAYEALKAGDPDALANAAIPTDAPVITICGAGKVSLTAMEQLRAQATMRALARRHEGLEPAWNSAEVPVPGSAATVIQVAARARAACRT